MQRVKKLLITAFTVLVAVNALAASDIQLDESCRAVNDAYISTRTTDRYREMISSPQPDGTLKPFQEVIFNGQSGYSKFAFAHLWKQWAVGWSLFDRDGPKFTDCNFISNEYSADGEILHYTTTWHKRPFMALMEVWFFNGNKKIEKTLRKYSDDNWEFSRPVLIEVFDYDTAAAVSKSRNLVLAPP